MTCLARLAVTLGLTVLPSVALANCSMRESLVRNLTEKYGERLMFYGLPKMPGEQSLLEVWANVETGTFTVLRSSADGISCIMNIGTGFAVIPAPVEPIGDPT